jgi:uncharacterized membrane protein YhfC
MVSTGLIVFMIFIGLLIVLLPVATFLVLRKKFDLKGVPILVGIAAFILFALILEQILHSIVMQPGADGTVALLKIPWLYVLYGVLSAGIFEETARFLSFKLLKDKYTGIGTSLSYGIGHGGIEALLLGGMLMLNNVLISFLINTGSNLVPAETVSALTAVQPHMFAITFAERAIAFVAQVSLSVLVWSAVNDAKKIWLYPAAILLHALIDTPAILYQIGALTNIYLVEVITAIIVAGVVVWAYHIIASHRPSPEPVPSDKQEHEPS